MLGDCTGSIVQGHDQFVRSNFESQGSTPKNDSGPGPEGNFWFRPGPDSRTNHSSRYGPESRTSVWIYVGIAWPLALVRTLGPNPAYSFTLGGRRGQKNVLLSKIVHGIMCATSSGGYTEIARAHFESEKTISKSHRVPSVPNTVLGALLLIRWQCPAGFFYSNIFSYIYRWQVNYLVIVVRKDVG